MVGDYIKKLRISYNYSQEQLGNLIGVKRAAVQKWECGRTQNLKRETILRLAEVFNVSPSSFIDDVKNAHSNALQIPVLGYVRAGIPIEAVEDILDYEELPISMANQGEYFGLKIKGNSMEPKISDGDVVIVRKQLEADNGDIVVVLINGSDATVKKYMRTESGIKLIATNPMCESYFFTPEEVKNTPVSIVGKVVELRAKFN